MAIFVLVQSPFNLLGLYSDHADPVGSPTPRQRGDTAAQRIGCSQRQAESAAVFPHATWSVSVPAGCGGGDSSTLWYRRGHGGWEPGHRRGCRERSTPSRPGQDKPDDGAPFVLLTHTSECSAKVRMRLARARLRCVCDGETGARGCGIDGCLWHCRRLANLCRRRAPSHGAGSLALTGRRSQCFTSWSTLVC